MKNSVIAFLLARICVGMSMFGHGAIRLPEIQEFSAKMVENFQSSPLPDFMVLPFGYIIPIAELIIGILLLIGLFTKQALIGGAVLMALLIFGSSMRNEFGPISSQLIHAAFFIVPLLFVEKYNGYAIDSKLNNR